MNNNHRENEFFEDAELVRAVASTRQKPSRESLDRIWKKTLAQTDQKRPTRYYLTALAAVLALVLWGAVVAAYQQPVNSLLTQPSSTLAIQQLRGTSWELALLNGTPPGRPITLDFPLEGGFKGYAACNSYTSTALSSLSFEIFKFAHTSWTLVGCLGDRAQLDILYRQALSEIAEYEIKDNQLIMRDTTGMERLVFRQPGTLTHIPPTNLTPEFLFSVTDNSVPMLMSPTLSISELTAEVFPLATQNIIMRSSIWKLVSMDGSPPGMEITLSFSMDGNFTGTACNAYGSLEPMWEKIYFSRAAWTQMECSGREGEIEAAYRQILNEIASYEIRDRRLILRDATGAERLIFEVASSSLTPTVTFTPTKTHTPNPTATASSTYTPEDWLRGTAWELILLDDAAPEMMIRIDFPPGGGFVGQACNFYSSSELDFSQAIWTTRSCSPQVDQVEERYRETLSEIVRHELRGGLLILYDINDVQRLVYGQPGTINHAIPTASVPDSPTAVSTIEASYIPLPGLLIRQPGEFPGVANLYAMKEDGELQHLTFVDGLIAFAYKAAGFEVSPDGRYVLYPADEEIWMLDVEKQTTMPVTDTPAVGDDFPEWWRDGFLHLVYEESGPVLIFNPLQGGEPLIIASGVDSYSASPDGIAYTIHRYEDEKWQVELWLYQPDSDPRQLDLATYGLENLQRIGDLSWSPDGELGIASVIENLNGEPEAAIIVLDIDAATARIVKRLSYREGNHAPLAHSAPRFDPQNEWLVFYYTYGEAEDNGVWVELDGMVARFNTNHLWQEGQGLWTWGYTEPYISSDGEWIILETGVNYDKLLVRTDDWYISKWNGVEGFVEGWVNP